MVKLKHLKFCQRNECPDHIVQEVDELMFKMFEALSPIVADLSPNILLSAFNRIHATFIVMLISNNREEIKNAVYAELKGLIGNVEDISGVEIFDKK